MSRTPDERLDQNPTAEVQGLRRDIGNSPSIREVSRSRSDGSSSRIREPASNLEQSPAQVAQMLLRSSQLANQQGVQATTGAGVSVINFFFSVETAFGQVVYYNLWAVAGTDTRLYPRSRPALPDPV